MDRRRGDREADQTVGSGLKARLRSQAPDCGLLGDLPGGVFFLDFWIPFFVILDSKKTTIDIPDDVLEAVKHTKAKTKREAIVTAVTEFNRQKRLAALAGRLGTFKDFMTQDELRAMREMD